MEVFKEDEVPARYIENSTEFRKYYGSSSDAFKIVITHVPPGHMQNEHSHKYLLDIVYVIEGTVRVYERANDVISSATLRAGDMVSFEPPFSHNMSNPGDVPATTLTMKIVGRKEIPEGLAEDIFDHDWIRYEE